jgi:hypothetical protein
MFWKVGFDKQIPLSLWRVFMIVLLSLFSSACRSQTTQEGPSSNVGLPAAPQLNFDDKALPNLSTNLSFLYMGWLSGEFSPDNLPVSPEFEISGNRVKVTLMMLSEADAQQAVSALPDLGGEVIVSYQTWVDAWVPIPQLGIIAALPGISLVREPEEVLPVD